jgi:ketosteroid isomerase-like protein
MRTASAFYLVMLMLGSASTAEAQGSTRPNLATDEQAIRAIIAHLPTIRDAEEEAAMYAPDAWFFSTRTPVPLNGREARRADIMKRREPATDESTVIEPDRVTVASGGDFAFDHGTYRTTWTEDGRPREVHGYYLRTWEKVGGRWMIAAESVQRRPLPGQEPVPDGGEEGIPVGTGEGAPGTSPDGRGAARALDKLMTLVGTWDAPLNGGVMTDVFRPIAKGTALLEEEWYGGKQSTATVFYLVGDELRADHFCDLLNQPRYTARPYTDATTLAFELREATGLEEHPKHFDSVTFLFTDADHHTQIWPALENGALVKTYTLEFTRRQ